MNSFLTNNLCWEGVCPELLFFLFQSIFLSCVLYSRVCVSVVCAYVHMHVEARGILQLTDGLPWLANEPFSVTQCWDY